MQPLLTSPSILLPFLPPVLIFIALAVIFVTAWFVTEGKGVLFRRKIRKFLGKPLDEVCVVQNDLVQIDLPNLHRAIGLWTATDQIDNKSRPIPNLELAPNMRAEYCERFGFETHDFFNALSGAKLKPKAIRFRMMTIAPHQRIRVPVQAAYLLRLDGQPALIWNELNRLCVASPDERDAENIADQLRNWMQQASFYRGQILSLSQEDHDDNGYPTVGFTFHELEAVAEGKIVLPNDTMGLLKRCTLSYLQVADQLVAHGQSGSRGLLLYGAPGTGKTLVTRWLLGQVPNATKFLVTGANQLQLKQTIQVARLLSPSILVLDDVDLIATHREANARSLALYDLMNCMDGIGREDQVMFLLTTNRPEAIESAIATRPGRIDQAIEFPMPDEQCRKRLLQMYCGSIDAANVQWDRWVHETDKGSPAFLKELIRRSLQNAILRSPSCCQLQDNDIRLALLDMLVSGGNYTKKLLGFGG